MVAINNQTIENFFHGDAKKIEQILEEYIRKTQMPQAAKEILEDIEALEHGELETVDYNDFAKTTIAKLELMCG